MKLPFQTATATRPLRKPRHAEPPALEGVDVGALYRAARTGGDYFDFVQVGPRLLLLMLDIAGERDEALDIAASVQEIFREGSGLLLPEAVNETVALSHLIMNLNRAILEAAAGVRCTPAFLGCYNQQLGTLCYINAGHTPALLRDGEGTGLLEAGGLPLGLFSHAMHEAQINVLIPGSALLVVSRGLVEARAGDEEFGLDRVRELLRGAALSSSQQLCRDVLEAVRRFVEDRPRRNLLGRSQRRPVAEHESLGQNDTTALALVRPARPH